MQRVQMECFAQRFMSFPLGPGVTAISSMFFLEAWTIAGGRGCRKRRAAGMKSDLLKAIGRAGSRRNAANGTRSGPRPWWRFPAARFGLEIGLGRNTHIDKKRERILRSRFCIRA